jgi:phytoene synthase
MGQDKACGTLDQSYAYCRKIARSRARNFYYSFLLLERDQKNAMCAMYAFMRFCDDLSDEQDASLAAIGQWQAEMEAALRGEYSEHPLWPAFDHSVRRFRIPHQYFRDIIAGVSSDLETRHIESFDDLYRYCYLVASVVGLTTIHIFGFDSPEAIPLAEKCGIAFQLTNILRDVREDAQNGRVYIPAEDLRHFATDLRKHDNNFVRLMQFETTRARGYYEQSRPLLDLIHKRSRPSLWALIQIYRRLLDRIERSNFDVLDRRISLPVWEKMSIVARAAVM